MTDQLWGIGGVVVGIVASGGVSWFTDSTKHKREAAAAASEVNKRLCGSFLADIEAEIRIMRQYEERHGVMPIDRGEIESPAQARQHLTALELKCPEIISRHALALIEALEAWAWAGGTEAAVQNSRAQFISTFRKKL